MTVSDFFLVLCEDLIFFVSRCIRNGVRRPGLWWLPSLSEVSILTKFHSHLNVQRCPQIGVLRCLKPCYSSVSVFEFVTKVAVVEFGNSSLRAMITQFVFFIGIAAICFSGLLFTLWTLGIVSPCTMARSHSSSQPTPTL
jgi:hypothetical protein